MCCRGHCKQRSVQWSILFQVIAAGTEIMSDFVKRPRIALIRSVNRETQISVQDRRKRQAAHIAAKT